MFNLSRHIFFVSCLLCSVVAFSQKEETVKDTVISITDVPQTEEQDTTPFDVAEKPTMVPIKNLPQRRVDSLKAEDDFWYANAEPEKKKLPEEKRSPKGLSLFQQQWFRDLLWVIILCSFIGVVLWYLASSNILIFRKKAKTILSGEEEEETTDDIFALNYEKEIVKAEQAGNFRLAVRLHYLQTLKQLAERALIDYRFGRTNSDYVLQLNQSTYYRDFFRLTRNFEYTWYGQFDLSAEAYKIMQGDFLNFKNGLR
jgi:hypothetical protein